MNEGSEDSVLLYRPVGPEELTLIQQSGFREFPQRLPEQPIFYPVLTLEYAEEIAAKWNVRDSTRGFVTRFRVQKSFLDAYKVQKAGSRTHLEYWIPAEDMDRFNASLIGQIEVIKSFPS